MKRSNALTLLVGAAFCFSLGGVLIKLVDLHPVAIAGYRSAIAALFVYVAFPRMKLTWSAHQLLGAVAYAANMITLVAATKMTTAANAILLQYTAPAWVALFSVWFLRERIRKSDWMTIAVVTGGITLFFFDRLTFTGLWGNLWGIASGLSFAWVLLLFRRQKDEGPYGSVFLGNVLTVVVCLPFMMKGFPDIQGGIGLALLGTVQMGAAFSLYSVASRYVTALTASIVLLLEAVLNPVWTFLAIGEVPGSWAMAGGAIILAAITFQAFSAYGNRSQ